MATRQPSTLFDLPNWYKETPGARLSRVSGNPFKAATLPQVALPAALTNPSGLPQAPVAPTVPQYTGKLPDSSALNPILERIKAEQAKVDPLKTSLTEAQKAAEAARGNITTAVQNAYNVYAQNWLNVGMQPGIPNTPEGLERYRKEALETNRTNREMASLYAAYDAAKAAYQPAVDAYKTNLSSYNSALAPFNAARQEYETAFAPYKADVDAYNAQIAPLKDQYSKDYAAYRSSYDANKATYDLIQQEQQQAKKGYQDEVAGISLRRAAPVTDEVPVEQLIAGPMESTAQRQANLGLYSDDLATMMQARKGR